MSAAVQGQCILLGLPQPWRWRHYTLQHSTSLQEHYSQNPKAHKLDLLYSILLYVQMYKQWLCHNTFTHTTQNTQCISNCCHPEYDDTQVSMPQPSLVKESAASRKQQWPQQPLKIEARQRYLKPRQDMFKAANAQFLKPKHTAKKDKVSSENTDIQSQNKNMLGENNIHEECLHNDFHNKFYFICLTDKWDFGCPQTR